MTAAQVLHQFYSSFGIPAYEVTKVPDNAFMPYITYDFAESELDLGEVNSTVNIFYYTTSNVAPNAMVEAIGNAIGRGGKSFKLDNGYLWIKKGSPWAQIAADENPSVNRRYLNITLEYLT